MTQGDRRLFVIEGSSLQPMYQVDEEAVVFYDVKLLRIKKSLESRDRSGSNASDVEMVLPELTDNRGYIKLLKIYLQYFKCLMI